jgi:hypothetical protein
MSGKPNPSILSTLAAAHAEAGQFADAVSTARRALDLAAAQTNAATMEVFQARLELYRSGSLFRDATLAPVIH